MTARVVRRTQGVRDADELRSFAAATLVDHLVVAGRRDQLHELLSRERRDGSAWFELKQSVDDEQGYERDVGVAWQFADSQFREAQDDSQRGRAIGLQVQYALIIASLHDMSDRLSPEELRRYVESGEWSMTRARAVAARVSDPTRRAQLFADLVGVGGDADIRALTTDALRDANRSVALATLAERLPPEALVSVVVAARASDAEDDVAEAIAAVASRLPASEVEPVLREAMLLTSTSAARAHAVVALAPRAPATLAEEVVFESGLLDDDDVVLALLESQSSALSPGAVERALEVLQRLPVSERRAAVAVELLHAVQPDHRERVLRAERSAARRIRALEPRAEALAVLGLDSEAVRVAAELSGAPRAATIAAIAPHLTPTAASAAIKALTGVESPTANAEALVALAPVIEPASALRVLQMVETLRLEKEKAKVLVALAPGLPEARLSLALKLALRIRDPEVRAVAVAALEPRLSEKHRRMPHYRRRTRRAATADVDAALREWDTPTPPRDAPRREETGGVPEAIHVHDRGTEQLDGAALRQRLIETIRSDQSDYAALRSWRMKTVSAARGGQVGEDETWDLKQRLARAAVGGSGPPKYDTRQGKWAESTLRRHLSAQLTSRRVDLDDPRVQAALELADPVAVRTALDVGLERAVQATNDWDSYYIGDESPSLPDIAPVFARHGRLGDVIEAARDMEGPYDRAEALFAVLSHVDAPARAAIASEALSSFAEACKSPPPRMWWQRLDFLELLAPELDDAGMKAMAAQLRMLGRRNMKGGPPGDTRRAIVIESQLLLALHATPPLAAELAADALAVAAQCNSEAMRSAVLDALVPQLPTTAIDAAAATASTLSSGGRAAALAAIALRAADLGAAAEASNLIEQIAKLPDLFVDPAVSTQLGEHADLLTPMALDALWCSEAGAGLLHDTTGASRDEVVQALDDMPTLLSRLGGLDTMAAVAQARDLIVRWWP